MLAGCASSQKSYVEYVVILDTAAVRKLVDTYGVGYPWPSSSVEGEISEITPHDFVFGEYEYSTVLPQKLTNDDDFPIERKDTLTIRARGQFREDHGSLSNYIYGEHVLVRLRYWDGVPYIEDSAEIFSTMTTGDTYIADPHFIENNGLGQYRTEIEFPEQTGSCEFIDESFDIDEFDGDKYDLAQMFGSYSWLCFITEVVYLKDLVPADRGR